MKTQTTKQKASISNAGKWLSSKDVRPKTVVLTMVRTQHGYIPQNAVVVSKKNQHASQSVAVDVNLLVTDLNKKGIVIR